MKQQAQISIQADTQFGSVTRYSWSVKPLGLHGDEAPGCPRGANMHSLAAACTAALGSAIAGNDYDGVRVTYTGANGVIHSLDAWLDHADALLQQGQALASALMAMEPVRARSL